MSSVDPAVKRESNLLDFPRSRADTARQFLPAALEIVETPASPVGRAIGATVILFFAVAIGWATFGQVDIIATAQGKIVPTGRTKTIQPLEAGIVTAIRVRDGDEVSAGQVLIELDQTVARADWKRVQQDLVLSELDVARLAALRDRFDALDRPHDLAPPKDALPADVQRTRSALLAQAAEQLKKMSSIEQQIKQKEAETQSVVAAIAKIDGTMPLIEETADIRQKAMNIGYGNRIAYLEAQTRLVDQRSERIVEQRKLAEAEAARRALQEQLAQTKAGFERQALSDLSDARKKVEEFSQDLIKAQRKLQEQQLRAPIDGTVQQLAVHTVGGVVTPAQQLMTIVPAKSHLEIETMVSNRDIGFVSAGQAVDIKIDTFNFTRYGLLHGTVTSVSQDSIVRDKVPKSGGSDTSSKSGALSDSSEPAGQELMYAARVSLDRTQMQIDDKLVNLTPGMAVTVEIKTGKRRIIQYLMSPLLRYRQESLRER